MVGWSRCCIMPSASVCGAWATSATSATGAAGTPASVNRPASTPCRSSRSASSRIAQSSSRWRPDPGSCAKRGSSTSSGRPTTAQIDANRRSLPPAIISSPSRVGNTWYGATIGNRVPWPCGTVPVGEVAGEVIADVAERGLVERDVDDGSLAGATALEQRREHAERRPRARALVDQRRADPHAGPAGLARHRDQAAGGLHQRVVAGLVAERPDVAVGAHRAVDETGVARRAARRRRARARRRARGGGSAGRRPRRRRVAAAPRGRAGRGARARASACPRWRRGTSSPRRSRTAAPRRDRRPPCRVARP